MNIPVWLAIGIVAGLAWLAIVFEFCLFIGRIAQDNEVDRDTELDALQSQQQCDEKEGTR